MEKLVKVVSINDGTPVELYNGNRLYTITYPRTEKVIAAFLNAGWDLYNKTECLSPNILEDGNGFPFYKAGWNMIFIKDFSGDETDNGDQILQNVLQEF